MTRQLWGVTPAASPDDRMAILQVIDNIPARRIHISIHLDGVMLGWVELDDATWEHFKRCGDDARDIALGRIPPRKPDDPDAYQRLPG